MQQKNLCGEHGEQLRFVCMNPKCPDTKPVCAQEVCVLKHSHGVDLDLYPIEMLSAQLQERETASQQRRNQLKLKLSSFHNGLRSDLAASLKDRTRDLTIVDKVVLSMDIDAETKESLDALFGGKFEHATKGGLIKLARQVKSNNKSDQLDQLACLESSIQNKANNLKTMLEGLRSSLIVKTIFSMPLYDSSSMLRINRFTGEGGSWSFSPSKTDSITFTSSQDKLLYSFFHFKLTTCPPDGINIRVKITTGGATLCQFDKQVPNAVAIAGEFEIVFPQMVDIVAKQPYEISSQNIGAQFNAICGSGSRDKCDPFKITASKYDNNGTSATNGQFKGFVVYSKL